MRDAAPRSAAGGARPRRGAPVDGPSTRRSEPPPIVVWTPRGSDARVLLDVLSEGGMAGHVVGSAARVVLEIERAGCLVVAQEALGPEPIDAVARALVDQPAWSELPILVLADRMDDVFSLRSALEPAWGEAQVTYLTRPVAPLVLMAAVHAALTARMRQFLLRDQFAQEAELRRELNHRVKNILVTVQAMAKMTERSGGGEAERFAAFQARLAGLSAVHAMLFDAPEEASRFEALARVILRPHGLGDGPGGGRVTIAGPGRPLRPEAAKTLGLVVQELTTNALKYGALSAEAGGVALRLDAEGERARLTWREAGGAARRTARAAGLRDALPHHGARRPLRGAAGPRLRRRGLPPRGAGSGRGAAGAMRPVRRRHAARNLRCRPVLGPGSGGRPCASSSARTTPS